MPAALDACLSGPGPFWDDDLQPGRRANLEAARSGVHKAWHADLARTLRELSAAEARGQGLRDRKSRSWRDRDRSRGLRLVADAFYRGPIARGIDAWSRKRRPASVIATWPRTSPGSRSRSRRVPRPFGLQVRSVDPGAVSARGPPDPRGLRPRRRLGHNRPQAMHVTVEAMKLGFADRDTYYADPLFAEVPDRALLDPAYAAQAARPAGP